MNNWKECKLGDVITTNNKSIQNDYPFKEILYLDTGSITKGRINEYQKYSIYEAPSRAKRLVKENDIIYSTVRPIQKHYGFIKNPPENLVVSTGFAVIETNVNVADPRFVYFLLTTNDVVDLLDSIAEGSTSAYPSIKPGDIENLDVLLPPLPEQKAIASVLSSLDDKIDLLHRQNKTLESMAETLFRKWFVEDETLDEEIILGDFVECINGYSYKSSELNNSDVALVTLKSFERNGGLKFNGFKEFNGKFKKQHILNEGDLVVAHTDITQDAEVLGNPARIIKVPEYKTLVMTMDLVKVVPKDERLSISFLYHLFKTPDFKFHCLGCANGTTVLHLSKAAIPSYKFNKPDLHKLKSFTNIDELLFKKIIINYNQIRTLEKLRDTLLPKLMSGTVSLSNFGEVRIKK
ncbi:MAG: restriction endonuclease subunit S [Ignavibacteria bacterium]|nr:restriction endonuclease subunit S [Ignavibacteria bacterium]